MESIVEERTRVLEALADLGVRVEPSQANFVWMRLGARHWTFLEACHAAALAVRPYGDEGVRITIGEPVENDRFLRVVAHFVEPS